MTSASRIFKVMRKAGDNTISNIVYLTVQSTNPLIFKASDKLYLSKDLYILSDDIVVERLKVGTKVLAFTFDDSQKYFIHQTNDDTKIKREVIDNTSSGSSIDMLSAKQGKLLNTELLNLKSRVSTLDQKVNQILTTLDDYGTRITALENKVN